LSFWRTNPLDDERLSLFVAIVERVLLDDPDLEGARTSPILCATLPVMGRIS